MTARISSWLLAGSILSVSLPALALDLPTAWQAAQQHDRELAVARAAHAAAQPLRAQAAALWRPGVQLTANVGIASHDSQMRGAQFSAPGMGSNEGVDFSTSIQGGGMTRWAIQASQPLINPQRRAQQQQLHLKADMAELQWQAAQQQARLRTLQRYLDVALAEQTVAVSTEQLTAVQQALEQAQERFRIGSAPVTETHEARARLAALRAQQVAQQVDLDVKRRLLADLTGLPMEALHPWLPRPSMAETVAKTPVLPVWLQQAEDSNLQIRLQRLTEQMAQAEAQKHSRSATTTLELVAQASQERLHGSGDYGNARNKSGAAMLGVQLTVPLSTGGWRSAKEDEAQRQVEHANAQLDNLRQQISSQVHATWLGLQAGIQRVQALDQALLASQARLDATQTGREAGDRTLLDWLSAQSDTAHTQLSLLQARSALLQAEVVLSLLTGKLDDTAWSGAQQSLQAPPAQSRP